MTTLEIDLSSLKSRIAVCQIGLLWHPGSQSSVWLDALGALLSSVDEYGESIGDAEGKLLGDALGVADGSDDGFSPHFLGPYTKAACPYVKGEGGTDALVQVLFKLEVTLN